MHALGGQVWTRPGGPRWRVVKQTIAYVEENQAFPQLYIYSTADAIIYSSSIEAHMQARRPGSQQGMAAAVACYSYHAR